MSDVVFITSIKTEIILDELVVDKTTAYLHMLVEGEGAPPNYFDSCRGYLLVGSLIMISILVGDTC